MTQRSALPSPDPVYSEVDVAEMRLRWEQVEKDRRVENQIAALAASVEAFPVHMEEIARRVVLQVLSEQRHERDVKIEQGISRLSVFSQAIQAMTAVGVLYLALHAAHFL